MESMFEPIKDEVEHFSHEVKKFIIVLLNSHFEIQPDELAHMPVSKGVLSSEDWGNLVDSVEVRHDAHLFVQLGRLGEASLLTEVLQSEDVCAALRSSTDQFRGVDLDKTVLVEILSEQRAYAGGYSENSLFSGRSKIDDSVVQTSLKLYSNFLVVTFFGFLLLFLNGIVELLAHNLLRGIFDLERELVGGPVNNKKFVDLDFNFLGAGLDGLVRLLDGSFDVYYAFTGDSSHIFDLVLGHGLGLEGHSLHRRELLP